MEIENGIYLGQIGALTFRGPFEMKDVSGFCWQKLEKEPVLLARQMSGLALPTPWASNSDQTACKPCSPAEEAELHI